MEYIDKRFKKAILLATYILILSFLLLNFKEVMSFLGTVIRIIKPFIWGIAIAFVLNIPMSFVERHLGNGKFIRGMKRIASITITLVILVLAITIFILFVVPQLAKSLSTLVESIPGYLSAFEKMLESNAINNSQSQLIIQEVWSELVEMWREILKVTSQIIGTSLSYVLDFTLGLTFGIVNFFLALILAIYMLASKEVLIRQMKKITYAFLKKDKADKLIELAHMSDEMFSKFIAGQCTEAVVIGVLCFIGMIIFRTPYALLISVIIGVTALIPIFGAFLGTIPAAFIIFIIDPIKAVWFILFIIILQQLEGNFIYPRVVGSSIGLSALWVMFAMIVGGSLFGVIGMLIGIPIFGICYRVLNRVTNRRLRNKGLI
ncbi:AI-2E family transporter [Clostridium sp. B9]|uniref:AI-2E family transporter n=1 Tax=Clostridium sp. B9 TaxID=3423224 RepID=UPI003D2F09FC